MFHVPQIIKCNVLLTDVGPIFCFLKSSSFLEWPNFGSSWKNGASWYVFTELCISNPISSNNFGVMSWLHAYHSWITFGDCATFCQFSIRWNLYLFNFFPLVKTVPNEYQQTMCNWQVSTKTLCAVPTLSTTCKTLDGFICAYNRFFWSKITTYRPPNCCWCDVTKHVWYLLWADSALYQLPGSLNWIIDLYDCHRNLFSVRCVDSKFYASREQWLVQVSSQDISIFWRLWCVLMKLKSRRLTLEDHGLQLHSHGPPCGSWRLRRLTKKIRDLNSEISTSAKISEWQFAWGWTPENSQGQHLQLKGWRFENASHENRVSDSDDHLRVIYAS